MDVVITEWALQSYLDLKHQRVFSASDCRNIIRPDVELLRDAYPTHKKFSSSGFWGRATDKAGIAIPGGYKMKWHNLGPGRVQLRVGIALVAGSAYLCQAYVKNSPAKDKRECAKLKKRIDQIQNGQFQFRGKL